MFIPAWLADGELPELRGWEKGGQQKQSLNHSPDKRDMKRVTRLSPWEPLRLSDQQGIGAIMPRKGGMALERRG